MDVAKLEKLFRVLGTAQDTEALAALYAIKRHIGEERGAWHRFVNQLVAVGFGTQRSSKKSVMEEWESAFRRGSWQPPPQQPPPKPKWSRFPDGEKRVRDYLYNGHEWWEREEVWSAERDQWETTYEGPRRQERRYDQAMDGINARFNRMQFNRGK